jgi:hypothetical protein
MTIAYVISIYSDGFIEVRDIFGDDFLALSSLLSADCLIFAGIFFTWFVVKLRIVHWARHAYIELLQV